ncbi:MAG: hypothetical protein SGI90_07240, partial [Candidatus Eisenbacteria bacterium]|nr:hypothetical protein [Candidatus Eisenbacteria bacterium]
MMARRKQSTARGADCAVSSICNSVSPGLISLLLVLFTLSGCDGGCARRDPGPGGLSVVLTIPRDAVEEVSSVDVLFDQPMVAVGATTTAVTDPPFTLRPRVAG